LTPKGEEFKLSVLASRQKWLDWALYLRGLERFSEKWE